MRQDTQDDIIQYFTELYENNKYLIKIYNTVDNNWRVYMFKNQHIQLDIQTPSSLTSKHIDVPCIIEYIEKQESDIKIAYTCYYDDFEEYKKKIQDILHKITQYYAKKGRTICVKYRTYWN